MACDARLTLNAGLSCALLVYAATAGQMADTCITRSQGCSSMCIERCVRRYRGADGGYSDPQFYKKHWRSNWWLIPDKSS